MEIRRKKGRKRCPPGSHRVHSKNFPGCLRVAFVEATLRLEMRTRYCARKVVFDWHLHEDRYSQNPNNPASPMNRDCINGIVNPQRDKQSGEEKIDKSSKGSNDA